MGKGFESNPFELVAASFIVHLFIMISCRLIILSVKKTQFSEQINTEVCQRVSTEECEERSISSKEPGDQLATTARDHSFWRARVIKLFHGMSSWDRRLS